MAQNITLLGASYSDCPAVLLPKTGGGTARFDDASVTTATAADVASGKIFLASNGTITTGTNSGGGGGSSTVVTGTFKGTTTGAAIDVTVNYSGNGYPIIFAIMPTGGNSSDFYNLIQRYAIDGVYIYKANPEISPSYTGSGSSNGARYVYVYKSSTSNSKSRSTAQGAVFTYYDNDATASGTACIQIRSKTKFSAFIASTSYGFAANIEYTYFIIYSS